MMAVLEWLKGKWWVPLLGVLVVPYLAYQNMKDRKARELGEVTYVLDERIDGVRLVVNRDQVSVTYQDGTSKPADGIGIAGVTLEDHVQSPERLKAQSLKNDDFPVVVFFNRTGFDSTGVPVSVCRARDGACIYGKTADARALGYLLRAVAPLRAGGWVGYHSGGKVIISEEEWLKTYLNAPRDMPSQEELDKMTPQQLKELGITRVPREETPKEKSKEESPKEKPKSKTGVRGYVVKVGGNPAVVPLKVPVHFFKGRPKFEPGKPPTPKDQRIAGSTSSDSEGKYSADLPPGEYTMAIELDGRLWGNAAADAWPSFKVPEGDWVEYDFRKGR